VERAEVAAAFPESRRNSPRYTGVVHDRLPLYSFDGRSKRATFKEHIAFAAFTAACENLIASAESWALAAISIKLSTYFFISVIGFYLRMGGHVMLRAGRQTGYALVFTSAP
jgi:hypothetical protein